MCTHVCMCAHALAGVNMQCSLLNCDHTFLGVGREKRLCLQLLVFQVNREKEFSEEQMGWIEE